MSSIFIGLYGLYLILVGVQGNAGKLIDETSKDAPQFFPWLVAIIVLGVLAGNEKTEGLVLPITSLLALNFLLRNYKTVEAEMTRLFNISQGVKNGQ